MAGMLELDEAIQRMLGDAPAVTQTEVVGLFEGLGRVLACDVTAQVDIPPADTSAMDGYALRAADVSREGARLPVVQRLAAGAVGDALAAGAAARIFTGAVMPAGADAVVMQEHCERDGSDVIVQAVPRPGQNVRRQAEDVARGTIVLRAGDRLTPGAMGLAASVGLATVQVRSRVRVAVLSTGDELTLPGEPLPPGGIYNSNRFMLRGLVHACGAACTDLGLVADDLAATRAVLRQAAFDHDLVISTGGVSVGEEDHLKAALQAEGELALWQLAIKPGKPLAFGHLPRQGGGRACFAGLPGNPVAAWVTFLLVVRPLLAQLAGERLSTLDHWRPASWLRAAFDWTRPDPRRREFLRARRLPTGEVEIFPRQGSASLSSANWAQGLVDLAPGQCVQRGETVPFISLADLLDGPVRA